MAGILAVGFATSASASDQAVPQDRSLALLELLDTAPTPAVGPVLASAKRFYSPESTPTYGLITDTINDVCDEPGDAPASVVPCQEVVMCWVNNLGEWCIVFFIC